MNRVLRWFKAWELLSLRSALVAAFAIYILAGFLAVPPLAKRIIADLLLDTTGREATIRDVRCNPLTLSLTVRGFSLPDRPGSTMLAFEELYANAQLSSLFRWAATLKELRVEEPYLALRRFPDGRINLLELIDDIEERAPEESSFDGLPRALLQRILVSDIHADYEDLAQEPAVLLRFGPGALDLENISTIPGETGKDELRIRLASGGNLHVSGYVEVEPFVLGGTATLEGIQLAHPWEAVRQGFEFDIVSGQVSGEVHYALKMKADGPHVAIDDLAARIDDLSVKLRGHDVNILEVPLTSISGGRFRWPEARVAAERVEAKAPVVRAWLEPDGSPSWASLVKPQTRERVVRVARNVAQAAEWVVSVERFDLSSGAVRFDDRSHDPPVPFRVDEGTFTVTGMSTEPGKECRLTGSGRLYGGAQAAIEGTAVIAPPQLETNVRLQGFDLPRLQPYVESLAPLRLTSGTLSADGRARLATDGDGPLAGFSGTVDITGLTLEETAAGTRLLAGERIELDGVEASVEPLSLTIGSTAVHGADIEVVITEDGRINLLELAAAFTATDGDETGVDGGGPAPAGTSELPRVDIAAVELHDASATLTDNTKSPPFTLGLESIAGRLSGISSEPGARTTVEMSGEVRTGGSVTVDGELELLDPNNYTEVAVDVRQTVLPPMSPMSASIIGYLIKAGLVDLDLHYRVVDSRLEGSNLVVTRGFTLGDKSGKGPLSDLPIELGVSLLTDRNGEIRFDVPVTGSLDAPGFSLGSVVAQASKQVLKGIIEAPFKLLGRLGGTDGDEDLSCIEFAGGERGLDEKAERQLDAIAAGLAQRPSLVLQVEGCWNSTGDVAPLRERRFAGLVAGREETIGLLESLYREQHTAEDLETLRSAHLVAKEGEDGRSAGLALNETAYRDQLRAELVAAQPVSEDELRGLGAARAEAVRAYLAGTGGVDLQRIEVTAPVAVEGDDGRTCCRLDLRPVD